MKTRIYAAPAVKGLTEKSTSNKMYLVLLTELSDGSWKQVAFQSTPDGAQLLVDNSIKMMDLERELFTNYTETPFENTMGGACTTKLKLCILTISITTLKYFG